MKTLTSVQSLSNKHRIHCVQPLLCTEGHIAPVPAGLWIDCVAPHSPDPVRVSTVIMVPDPTLHHVVVSVSVRACADPVLTCYAYLCGAD